MEDDLDGGLLALDFGVENEPKSREQRVWQSEEAFREQMVRWRPLCQAEQAVKRIGDREETDAMVLKAAAEERYYMRDYGRAAELADKAIAVDGDIHPNERKELDKLVEACKAKTSAELRS